MYGVWCRRYAWIFPTLRISVWSSLAELAASVATRVMSLTKASLYLRLVHLAWPVFAFSWPSHDLQTPVLDLGPPCPSPPWRCTLRPWLTFSYTSSQPWCMSPWLQLTSSVTILWPSNCDLWLWLSSSLIIFDAGEVFFLYFWNLTNITVTNLFSLLNSSWKYAWW